MADAVATGAAMAVALGAIEVAKALATRVANGKNGAKRHPCPATTEHTIALANIERVLGRTDDDGMPLVYASRTLARDQRDMLEQLRAINSQLAKIDGHLTRMNGFQGLGDGGA